MKALDTIDAKYGTWIVGCGTCDTNYYVKNCALVAVGPMCRACQEGTSPGGDWATDRGVQAELDWCGCGNPEDVDRWMLAYLESRASEAWPKPSPEGVSEDAQYLLAMLADKLGWTEHGGSVGGCWLTDAGRTTIENLRVLQSQEYA